MRPTRAGVGRAAALLLPVLSAACANGGVGTGPEAAPSPASRVEAAAATITAAEMAREIGALAHDSMRGRDTPSPELEEAAEYLAGKFRALGLEPAGEAGTYLHRYDYQVARLAREDVVVRVEGQTGEPPRYERDYFLVPGLKPRTSAPAYYLGTAGEIGAFPEEARGRIVVIDHPVAELSQEWQQKLTEALQPAMMSGVAGIVVVLHPEFPGAMLSQLVGVTAQQQAPFPLVGITDEAARQLALEAGADLDALRAAGTPAALGDAPLEIAATRQQELHRPPNVAALLPGSDPTLKDSYVVVTAHFDHVGVGQPDETGDSIFNGADDDASGTAAVLEIAEALASLPEAPGRSVLFLAVSGEEKGLLGSMAFAESPTVPIEQVVANVNMDMIGRNAPDTVIGIGQEYSSLEGVLQRITAEHPELGLNVILDPEPEKMFFFRSDQLAFIKQGIPAVFFTTDDHEDYHKVSDEAHKIDADKAARIARLGFYLTHAIATDPEAPEWTEEGWQRVEEMLEGSPF